MQAMNLNNGKVKNGHLEGMEKSPSMHEIVKFKGTKTKIKKTAVVFFKRPKKRIINGHATGVGVAHEAHPEPHA